MDLQEILDALTAQLDRIEASLGKAGTDIGKQLNGIDTNLDNAGSSIHNQFLVMSKMQYWQIGVPTLTILLCTIGIIACMKHESNKVQRAMGKSSDSQEVAPHPKFQA